MGPSLLPSLQAAVLLGVSGYAWPGAGIRRQPGLCLALKLCPQSLQHSSESGRAKMPSGKAAEIREMRLRRLTVGRGDLGRSDSAPRSAGSVFRGRPLSRHLHLVRRVPRPQSRTLPHLKTFF